NFGAAREDFVAFIETNWDHARLESVPRLLEEVAGALRILELPQPADYLEGVRRYIVTELIGRRRVPSGRQLDTLADAMASLEYYLEALRDRRPNRNEILEIARSSLEALSYSPLPEEVAIEPAPAAAPASPVAANDAAAFAPQAPAAPAQPAPVAAGPLPPVPGLDVAAVEPPRREVFEVPGLEIELPPVAPQAPEVPASLPEAQRFTYDPASGEYIAVADAAPSPAAHEGFGFDAPRADSAPPAPPALPEADQVFVDSAPQRVAPPPPLPPVAAEPPAPAPAAPTPPAASEETWLDVTVQYRPRTPAAEPPPAAEPTVPATPVPAQAPAASADAAEQALLAELAAAAAALPGSSIPGMPVAPAAPAVPPAPPVAESAPTTMAPSAGGFDDNQDIDADIRDVFLEEF